MISRAAVLLAAALTAPACDLLPGNADPFPEPCPDEAYGNGDGYSAGARECLWKAYTEGKAASFQSTRVTPQRDPIVYRVTVRAGKVEIFYDNSLDTFSGTKGKYTLTCSTFQRSVDPGTGRIRFFADNCRGADIRALVF